MKKKSLKRGFSERIDFKRELIRDTTKNFDVDESTTPPSTPTEEKTLVPPKIVKKANPSKSKKDEAAERIAIIKVIGIGGGGNNAVNQMAESGLEGVDLVAVNTDIQSLKKSLASEKLQIGMNTTRGLGTGGNPRIGEEAARQDKEKIVDLINGSELVFITACLGGGTGTGASPVIAQIAKEAGALTIGVVTKPFQFEGNKRKTQAEAGIEALRNTVDALIVIPNDRLMQVAKKDTSFQEAFKSADYILYQAVKGITDLISSAQDINLDLADLRTVLTGAGTVLIGIGHGRGREKAKHAAEEAIYSPLLEISIKGARSILLNITSGPDMTLHEVTEITDIVRNAAGIESDILFGNKVDETLTNEVSVTVIATRFEKEEEEILSSEVEENIESRIVIEDDLDMPAFLRESQRRSPTPLPEERTRTDEILSFFRKQRRE
ncbi:MAG: cell division protein FtsZ [Candidatus Atribacteria bacterium]|nr:cell division protein FtsZ [Candidatus Atribacteria bacterium]